MANHQARAVQARAGGLLPTRRSSAPRTPQRDRLPRAGRLDENTAEDNFLRHVFGSRSRSAEWHREAERFLAAFPVVEGLSAGSRRTQDRAAEEARPDGAGAHDGSGAPFDNEPDTDWSLPANRAWIERVIAGWRDGEPRRVPLQIGGEPIAGAQAERRDPSCPGRVAYTHALADRAQVSRALDVARTAQPRWAATGPAERRARLDARGDAPRDAAAS
jgi:RHH-type proline utilization regulon transcriptional repressor/proline dehydrogenase/delta 1-pyrroline-5-carboxylate dehydrogenase